MNISRRAVWCFTLIGALLPASVGSGAAMQRTGGGTSPTPAPTPDYSAPKLPTSGLTGMPDLGDPGSRRDMEEKRGNVLNVERQRAIVREAGQLVQLAAELQVTLAKDPQGPAREEAVRRMEAVEKLARNVRERMKGGR